ncbi:hypothetical protein Droror1_Dr00011441 [Drosera rotundifolia]
MAKSRNHTAHIQSFKARDEEAAEGSVVVWRWFAKGFGGGLWCPVGRIRIEAGEQYLVLKTPEITSDSDWGGSGATADTAAAGGGWCSVMECGGRLSPNRLVGGSTGVAGSALRRTLALVASGG